MGREGGINKIAFYSSAFRDSPVFEVGELYNELHSTLTWSTALFWHVTALYFIVKSDKNYVVRYQIPSFRENQNKPKVKNYAEIMPNWNNSFDDSDWSFCYYFAKARESKFTVV